MTAPDALFRICQDKLADLSRRKTATSIEALKGAIKSHHDKPRGFGEALKIAGTSGTPGLIAEIKKASPSGGLIRPDFDAAAIARAYKAGGATCLSVLTDAAHFQTTEADLKAARAAVDLPVLRKDFILDPWQIYESRAMGADCILLIMAALSDSQAIDLERLALALDMDVLAEVHNEQELDRALGLQTRLIGINNRNLKTLQTDLNVTLELASRVPLDRMVISESGIATNEDVQRLAAVGANCFLVGESLLRQPDVAAGVKALIGPVRAGRAA